MARPEMPFLAGGAVILIGSVRKERSLPRNAVPSLIGTVILVIIASATAGTRGEPFFHALGLLYLVSCIIAAVKLSKSKTK